jgi:hypothetical protein
MNCSIKNHYVRRYTDRPQNVSVGPVTGATEPSVCKPCPPGSFSNATGARLFKASSISTLSVFVFVCVCLSQSVGERGGD